MGDITGILKDNWIYLAGVIVIFWGNISEYINNYLLNLKKKLEQDTLINTPTIPVAPVAPVSPDNKNNTLDVNLVTKDLNSFEWITKRAMDAGDKNLLEEIKNVHKNFIITVYADIFKSIDGAK